MNFKTWWNLITINCSRSYKQTRINSVKRAWVFQQNKIDSLEQKLAEKDREIYELRGKLVKSKNIVNNLLIIRNSKCNMCTTIESYLVDALKVISSFIKIEVKELEK